MESKYYSRLDPEAKKRNLDDKQFTMDHINTKLVHLADSMNTLAAKEEAKQRFEFMQVFVAKLWKEI